MLSKWRCMAGGPGWMQGVAARKCLTYAPQACLASDHVKPGLQAQAPLTTTALGRQQLRPSPTGTLGAQHAHVPPEG